MPPRAAVAAQAAEKRRRNRINDRLAALREVVPIVGSACTGEFLAELLTYITGLQSLAGVQPKEALPPLADAAGGAAGAADAGGRPASGTAAQGTASDDEAGGSEELSGEPAAVAPPKRRRTAAR